MRLSGVGGTLQAELACSLFVLSADRAPDRWAMSTGEDLGLRLLLASTLIELLSRRG